MQNGSVAPPTDSHEPPLCRSCTKFYTHVEHNETYKKVSAADSLRCTGNPIFQAVRTLFRIFTPAPNVSPPWDFLRSARNSHGQIRTPRRIKVNKETLQNVKGVATRGRQSDMNFFWCRSYTKFYTHVDLTETHKMSPFTFRGNVHKTRYFRLFANIFAFLHILKIS